MEKLSSCSYLENDIDVVFIIKISIHFDDIRMIKIDLGNFVIRQDLGGADCDSCSMRLVLLLPMVKAL